MRFRVAIDPPTLIFKQAARARAVGTAPSKWYPAGSISSDERDTTPGDAVRAQCQDANRNSAGISGARGDPAWCPAPHRSTAVSVIGGVSKRHALVDHILPRRHIAYAEVWLTQSITAVGRSSGILVIDGTGGEHYAGDDRWKSRR